MIINSTNTRKRAMTSDLNLLNTKNTTTYNVGNPGLGLEQAHTYDGVKPATSKCNRKRA